MTGENECGCRLPCGVCMVTNRKCPMMPTINDFVYSTDDCVGGVHLTGDEQQKLIEEVKAKMNERFGKENLRHRRMGSRDEDETVRKGEDTK